MNEWYKLYTETAVRNNMTLHRKDYFLSLMGNQGKNNPGVKVNLLMAEHEGVFLSAMIMAISRNRATYLYGASSSSKRNLMATYAMQWEAIKRARDDYQCTEYDMFGTAPNGHAAHPMHGLYRYKKGFGGYMYHRMGCWDYPLMNEDYRYVKALEVNNQGYRV